MRAKLYTWATSDGRVSISFVLDNSLAYRPSVLDAIRNERTDRANEADRYKRDTRHVVEGHIAPVGLAAMRDDSDGLNGASNDLDGLPYDETLIRDEPHAVQRHIFGTACEASGLRPLCVVRDVLPLADSRDSTLAGTFEAVFLSRT